MEPTDAKRKPRISKILSWTVASAVTLCFGLNCHLQSAKNDAQAALNNVGSDFCTYLMGGPTPEGQQLSDEIIAKIKAEKQRTGLASSCTISSIEFNLTHPLQHVVLSVKRGSRIRKETLFLKDKQILNYYPNK